VSCLGRRGPGQLQLQPEHYGVVWDARARKTRKTRRFARVVEARNARSDLAAAIRNGAVAEAAGPKLGEARTRFVDAAREGVALNKWGRRYRRRAVQDLESRCARCRSTSLAGGCATSVGAICRAWWTT
jgi:hypothetical protein